MSDWTSVALFFEFQRILIASAVLPDQPSVASWLFNDSCAFWAVLFKSSVSFLYSFNRLDFPVKLIGQVDKFERSKVSGFWDKFWYLKHWIELYGIVFAGLTTLYKPKKLITVHLNKN